MFRAFAEQPVDQQEIAKAVHKIGKSLAVLGSCPADSPDGAAVADLVTLSALLEGFLARLGSPPVPPPIPIAAPPEPAARLFNPVIERHARAGNDDAVLPPPSADPANIDDLLLALERNKGLPANISRAVNAVFLHLLRALGREPVLRSELADTLDRLNECLALARAARGELGIAAAVSDLTRLSRLVEARSADARLA